MADVFYSSLHNMSYCCPQPNKADHVQGSSFVPVRDSVRLVFKQGFTACSPFLERFEVDFRAYIKPTCSLRAQETLVAGEGKQMYSQLSHVQRINACRLSDIEENGNLSFTGHPAYLRHRHQSSGHVGSMGQGYESSIGYCA